MDFHIFNPIRQNPKPNQQHISITTLLLISIKIASYYRLIFKYMIFYFFYVKVFITSYYLPIYQYGLYFFYNFFKDINSMIQELNQNLKQIVPYYQEASDLTAKTYKLTFETVNQMSDKLQSRINESKKNVMKIKQNMENEILTIIEQASNELLTRTQKLLLSDQERPSESEKKQLKKRFRRVFNKITNDYILFYAEQAKKYNMVLIQHGQQYAYTYIMPLYIKLKATLIVSKEILIQMLESRIDDMKMTYSVSKDTVTMLIGGKFQEDKIISKINEGMQNFKQFTVKVVKRGLQIKVDKKSLYENYQTFSLKILEAIRQVREKGTERIVSVKQRTGQLYKSVLNRIREKEICLKMQYKQIEDQKEIQGQANLSTSL